jgi:hypothetical protein
MSVRKQINVHIQPEPDNPSAEYSGRACTLSSMTLVMRGGMVEVQTPRALKVSPLLGGGNTCATAHGAAAREHSHKTVAVLIL